MFTKPHLSTELNLPVNVKPDTLIGTCPQCKDRSTLTERNVVMYDLKYQRKDKVECPLCHNQFSRIDLLPS